ncbi:MAG: helix-turn-helix transcriptional regulator [Deltaproteobacteria bacterium]|nr:helix-turn-helix transcriptional regulator [Deltaproteobacteria bacterium]
MSFKVSAENALLGILVTGPKHGYELHGYVSIKMNQFWDLSMSQVYALLKRLEGNGVVESQEEWQERRPAKKIFSLSPRGKERFLDWVSSPVEHVRDVRIEFLAKLFFVRELHLKEGLTLIDKQIDVLQEKLRAIENSREKVSDEFQKVLYSFKASQTTAALDWLRKCKASFSYKH